MSRLQCLNAPPKGHSNPLVAQSHQIQSAYKVVSFTQEIASSSIRILMKLPRRSLDECGYSMRFNRTGVPTVILAIYTCICRSATGMATPASANARVYKAVVIAERT